MSRRLLLSFVIVSILFIGFQTTQLAGTQLIRNMSLSDNPAPIVNSPLDVIYVEGNTGYSITWEISDNDPAYWVTTRNGEVLTAIAWETLNETVFVDVDGLLAGNYEFKIYACDGTHNTTDSVMVSVLSSDIEVHAPFSIYGNVQFNNTVQSEGWAGNGSAIDPYIIENLYIEASYDCISIHGTTVHFIIRNCTFVKSGIDSGIGLDMQTVTNGTIENCTFTNIWIGCITWFVSNCTWISNTFGNLADGILLQESTECTIIDNSFMSGGVSISGNDVSNWIHEISGNTISEKQLGYFEGLSSVDIDASEYGQVILANCHDVDIFNGDFSDVGSAISIAHSNFSGAYNCEVHGGRFGIFVERTYNTTIDSCKFFGMSEVGMYINETIRTEVYNCTIQTIGYVGAQILMGTNVTINETVIKGCGDCGIACFEAPYFYLLNSTIQDNNNGVCIGGCPESEIAWNNIQWNDAIGLNVLWGCEDSRIFGNEFGYNWLDNAYDDGTDTLWDDGYSVGNLWSDYGGSGFYYIPGSRGGIDHYPGIIDLAHGIDILDADDKSYIVGTTGHYIVWEPNCTHPSQYSIFKDDVLQLKQETWDGSSITYNIDGLVIGEYNFTVEILDDFGETASDTVIVTVLPEPTTSTTTTTETTTTTSETTTSTTTTTSNLTSNGDLLQITLIITIGSTVTIIVIIILILRTRKSPM